MDKPEKYINKFAVNEQQSLGFIMEFEQLNDQIVYLGVPVGKEKSNWVSINPLVIMEEVDPSALVEIVVAIAPPEKIIKNSENPQSISVSNMIMPINPIDWDKNAHNSLNDMKHLFDSLFKPPTVKPPEAKDFRIDNNEENEDDGA